MRRGPRAFSRDCTEDSDIPLSCEMKDEPAFKPLQGNPTFFQVRASRYPLHLRQQTQGHSHINITEGRLLLRCLWKGGLPLQQDHWNQLSSPNDMGCMELSSSSCAEIGVPIDLRRVLQGVSLSCPKEVKPLVLYDGERGIALKPMQGNWSSFRVDFCYP